jgi:anti-anti-sigma regulatory factor
MGERLRDMLSPRSQDGTVARKEYLLNLIVAVLGVLSLVGVATSGLALALGMRQASGVVLASGSVLLFCALAYWLGRRGRVDIAGAVLALAVWSDVTGMLVLGAWGSVLPAAYVLAIVFATLLSGWRGGLILSVVSLVSYGVVGWLSLAGRLPDMFPVSGAMLGVDTSILGGVLAIVVVLVHLFERQFWGLIARGQAEARQHAKELDALDKERRDLRARLKKVTDQQRTLLDTLHQISTPVLPLSEGLIVMPLSGQLDPQRAERLLDDVLNGITTHEADHVLLDVTGLLDIDAESVPGLLRAVQGARLLGGECVLIGVQPKLARSLVSLGLDLSEIPTYGTLREGVAEIQGEERLWTHQTGRSSN